MQAQFTRAAITWPPDSFDTGFGSASRGGRFGVPRFVWNMPYFFPTEMWKAKVIAAAGFGAELFAAVVLLAVWRGFGLWYTGVAVVHLAAYPWYAGDASDFRWFKRRMSPTGTSGTSKDASN